jgi:hypothetical protein
LNHTQAFYAEKFGKKELALRDQLKKVKQTEYIPEIKEEDEDDAADEPE